MNLEPLLSIAVVEDDLLFIDYLKDILANSPKTKLVNISTDVPSAIKSIKTTQPDVVLIDLDLHGDSSIPVINAIKMSNPKVEFIVLTVFSDNDSLFTALQAGASGYILKSSTAQIIIKSILEVVDGGAPISPKMAKILASYFHHESRNKNPKLAQLTIREQQILNLLSEGYIAKKVASKINISYETVRSHQKNIYKKLQVHSLYEAISANTSKKV